MEPRMQRERGGFKTKERKWRRDGKVGAATVGRVVTGSDHHLCLAEVPLSRTLEPRQLASCELVKSTS